MGRRRRNGKKVTGLEFGATLCQILALIIFLPVLAIILNAQSAFGEVNEYLPVTVTYVEVEEYTTKNADGDTEIRYRCIYQYEVDGLTYSIEETKYSYIEVGYQEEKYYNPYDPYSVSDYPTATAMYDEIKAYIVICFLLQLAAIVCYGLLFRKKIKRKTEEKAYETQIRQDMKRNIEKYNDIHISVDQQRVFAILEPLRKKIQKHRRKVECLERWTNVSVGGNVIVALVYIVLRMLAERRIQKAKDILSGYENEFYKEYKKMIAEPVLNHIFENYQYRPSQGFSTSELTSFKLYKESVRLANTEDLIEGCYKGVNYRQADVRRNNTRNESKEFAFAGRVSVYDFSKNLNGEILIANKGNHNIVSGGLNKIDMESIAFNDRFDVYSSNPHIAYYVLTPQFMEYMMDLNVRGEFVLRIANNRIYILRNYIGGIFEPDMNRSLDVQFEIGKSYTELKEVLDFIDIMNLEDDVVNIHNLEDEQC